MTRKCIVCRKTDQQILCHRFPKRADILEEWRTSLRLQKFSSRLLMEKCVVCTLHFPQREYRHAQSRMLNSRAVPTVEIHDKSPFYSQPSPAMQKGQRLLNGKITPLKDENTVSLASDSFSEDSTELPDANQQEEQYLWIWSDADELHQTDTRSESADEADTLALHEQLSHPICKTACTQTEPVKLLTVEEVVQQEIIEELYPDYVGRSKLTLIKELKELQKKFESIET